MTRSALVLLLASAVTGCSTVAATPEEAKKFIDNVNTTALRLGMENSQAAWVQATYITDDTQAISARANQAYIDTMAEFAKEAVKFDKVEVPADVRRQLNLLKLSLTMATPSDPKEGEELTKLASKLKATYGKGKWCEAASNPESCLDIDKITNTMAESFDEKRLRQNLGRLAHHFAADAQGLRALRGAFQQRCERNGLRRYRRYVALEVRHARGGIHEGTRPTVGAGAAALHVPSRLRPDEASRKVWRYRPCQWPDTHAPSGKHLGAGLDKAVA